MEAEMPRRQVIAGCHKRVSGKYVLRLRAHPEVSCDDKDLPPPHENEVFMTTYKQLLAQKANIEAQLAEARSIEVGNAIEKIRSLMAQFGLTVDDIAPKRGRGRPKSVTSAKREPLPPKYRHPKTGQTWSGRGRAPTWLGARPERFLIESSEG
jgi:DNA-binding protein H-NS